jgi:hypothetical protein
LVSFSYTFSLQTLAGRSIYVDLAKVNQYSSMVGSSFSWRLILYHICMPYYQGTHAPHHHSTRTRTQTPPNLHRVNRAFVASSLSASSASFTFARTSPATNDTNRNHGHRSCSIEDYTRSSGVRLPIIIRPQSV